METNLIEFVKQQEPMFMPVLSDDSIKWEKESQFCIQAIQNNDYLAKIAVANINSFQNAIINVASIGISLNPASKLAYLVPRDGRVCLDVSYMGLLHIATTEGSILWGQAKLVYANDTYENQGLTKEPIHKYMAFGDRGVIVGAYCVAKLPDGDYMTEEMDITALNKVRDTSKAKNGPWKTFPEEMMRKTVVKRASKYWPKPQQSRLDRAIEMLNVDNSEGLAEKDITGATEDQVYNFVQVCDLLSKEKSEALKVLSARDGKQYENPTQVSQVSMASFLEFANKMLDYKNRYADPMLEALENGDEFYIYECIEELTEEDQRYIWRAYTKMGLIHGAVQKQLRDIHAQVKKEEYDKG